MALNHTKEGISVYCTSPIEERSSNAIHVGIRELIGRKMPNGGTVLDIGCSDGVTTYTLPKCYSVLGIDLDLRSTQDACEHRKTGRYVCADVNALPFAPKSIDAQIVTAIDILEHLTEVELGYFLQNLRTIIERPDFSMIVSMPLVSFTSIPALRERIQRVRQGKRPDRGLFDRTHHILTNKEGHRKLFERNGFCIAESYYTNWLNGISGAWKEVPKPVWSNRPDRRAMRVGFQTIVEHIVPGLRHPIDKTKRPDVTESLIAYQGIYVLKPGRI